MYDLDKDDKLLLDELQEEVFYESLNILRNMLLPRCVEEFKRAIKIAVYSYEPVWWYPGMGERTHKFMDSVDGDVIIDGGKPILRIKIDTDKLQYYSWTRQGKSDRNVSLAVPYWIQEGHHDKSSMYNDYHHYEGRHYLEMAEELIKSDLLSEGIEVDIDIVNDEPNEV